MVTLSFLKRKNFISLPKTLYPPSPTIPSDLGLRSTKITESPRRNILLIKRSSEINTGNVERWDGFLLGDIPQKMPNTGKMIYPPWNINSEKKTPENEWLEDDFPVWDGIFWRAMVVSGMITILQLGKKNDYSVSYVFQLKGIDFAYIVQITNEWNGEQRTPTIHVFIPKHISMIVNDEFNMNFANNSLIKSSTLIGNLASSGLNLSTRESFISMKGLLAEKSSNTSKTNSSVIDQF